MKRCPCCGYSTIDDTNELITDICDICFWQYDEVAQNMPDRIIGANKVSLNTAKENYKLFGAIEERFINMVRLPYEDEIYNAIDAIVNGGEMPELPPNTLAALMGVINDKVREKKRI